MAEKILAEGAALMSGQEFCDNYAEILTELLGEFRKAVAIAQPRTAFEWKLAFEYFTQQQAFDAMRDD